MSYRYEYDETGGYDCMYGAYIVKDDGGKTIVEVDFRNFGQKPCEPPSDACTREAERVVRVIVSALNAEGELQNVPGLAFRGKGFRDGE